jgi:DNA repair exonuclease SbcCD ATPase subunit
LEAGKAFQSYITAYKDGVDKSTSTAFKQWEDLIKKWEDRLKTVDSLISNKLETIVREEAYKALSDEKQAFYSRLEATFNTLDAGKQELHQVVADSITSYVSELQGTLERSNQALVLNQKHLDAVMQELQHLQQCRGNNNSGNSNNNLAEERIGNTPPTMNNITLAEERIDYTMNNINHHSHIISNTPSNDNIVVPVAPTTDDHHQRR